MFREHLKMIINEYRLTLGTEEANKIVEKQMEDYFFGPGAALPRLRSTEGEVASTQKRAATERCKSGSLSALREFQSVHSLPSTPFISSMKVLLISTYELGRQPSVWLLRPRGLRKLEHRWPAWICPFRSWTRS
jgi:hypothetical protein